MISRERVVAASLGAFCIGVAVARYIVLTDDAPAPATIDGGNWLAFGRGLVGDNVRSSSIVYPPVVPLLVLAAVRATDAATGIGLISVAANVAVGAATYVALRDRVPPFVAAAAAALLTAAASTGEALAWGGYPQLFGFALATVVLRSLDEALTERRTRRWAWTGIWFAVLVATTHLIAGAVALAGAVLAALHLAAGRRSGRRPLGWTAAAWLVGPSLLVAPIYVRLVTEILAGLDDRPPFAQLELVDTPDVLRRIYGDFEVFWIPVLVLMVLTPIALADRWRTPLWRLLVGLVVASAVCTALLHEPRFLYFTALPAVVALALWASDLTRLRVPAFVLLALAVTIQTWTGLRGFENHVAFYQVVEPGVYDAIDWIDRNAEPDAVVAVANSADAPVGWWVEGLTGKRTLVGSPLRWLTFQDEQQRARKANAIFSETFPDEAAFGLADREGVDYLLVPARWAGGPRSRVRSFAAAHRYRVVVENRAAILFRV